MTAAHLPTISIVTPSYNQGQFLAATIESVLAQDYPAVEYRVIDGGSTDRSLAILQSYGDRLAWISEPDEGQSQAINKGWLQCQGEILAWLNSDDLYYPDALRQAATGFAENPGVDVLYGDCDYIDTAGRVTRAYPTAAFNYHRLVINTVNYIPQPATFIRRHVWDSLGGLDERLHYVMDFDYWLRTGLQHRFAYLPQRLACLRLHDDAKSITSLEGMADELALVYQQLFSRPDLPGSLAAQRTTALANIYLRAADASFWAGNLAKARRYAWMSWRQQPGKPRRLWWYLLLGKAGRRRAEIKLGNPYRAEL